MNINKLTFKQLFLIDGVGAIVSAVMLGLVLVGIQHLIGMPILMLYLLAGIALLFSSFSLSCFFLPISDRKPYLKTIAILNLLYCGLTVGLLIQHADLLTVWGFYYFISEICIVFVLGMIELKIANRPTQN